MPDTVYHLVVEVDPVKDSSWGSAPLTTYPTDEVHAQEIRQGQIQVRARVRTLSPSLSTSRSVCLSDCVLQPSNRA